MRFIKLICVFGKTLKSRQQLVGAGGDGPVGAEGEYLDALDAGGAAGGGIELCFCVAKACVADAEGVIAPALALPAVAGVHLHLCVVGVGYVNEVLRIRL